MSRSAAPLLAFLFLTAFGCQETKEPTITLTQAQWEEVKKEVLTAAPEKMGHKVGADFGGKFKLLGVDVEPDKVKPGQELTLTWYFECLEETGVNYQVFVHIDHKGAGATRQGADHHPVRDLYQTSRWKKGDIVRDRQKLRLRANFPGGPATLYVGIWDPATGRRLALKNGSAVKNDGDNRIEAATFEVLGKKAKPAAPRVYVARPLDGAIQIDGKLDDEGWKKVAQTGRFGDTRGGPQKAGITWAKVTRDDTHLYVGFYGEDQDAWGELDKRDADTWTQEVFELFIDPDGDAKDYLELQITPKGTLFDARFAAKLGRGQGTRQEQIDGARAWNGNIEFAASVDGTVNDRSDKDKSWSAEFKIPFADVPGGAPKNGATWKVNFYRFDAPRGDDGRPGRQVAWAWSPPLGSFHNVDRFGTLRFLGTNARLDPKPGLSTDGREKLTPDTKPIEAPKPGDGEVAPDKPE
jgi:hypothetical protein